jgi:hypothetical protein
MPHDIKGIEIEEGDVVVTNMYVHGRNAAALVVGVIKGTDTCNLNVCTVHAPNMNPQYVTAKESEILLKRDGTKPVLPNQV